MSEEPADINIPTEEEFMAQNAETKARSTVDLLNNGARMDSNERLVVTDEQLEEIAETHDYAPGVSTENVELGKRYKEHAANDAVGDARLVLHDTLQAEVDKPLQGLIAERERQEEFRAEINEALSAYDGIFLDHLPYDKAENEVEERSTNWEQNIKQGLHDVNYAYELHYDSSPAGNFMKAVQMDFGVEGTYSRHKKLLMGNRPGVSYYFEGGAINCIKIRAGGDHARVKRFLNAEPGHVPIDGQKKTFDSGAFSEESLPDQPERVAAISHVVDVTEALKSKHSQWGTDIMIDLRGENPMLIGPSNINYTYDHEADALVFSGSPEYMNDRSDNVFSSHKDSPYPKQISKQEFIDIVRGSLSFIPTMDGIPSTPASVDKTNTAS